MKKQSSCHGPTTQTLHRLTSLLGSCIPWLLVLIWIVRPVPWWDLGIYSTKGRVFCVMSSWGFCPMRTDQFAAALQHPRGTERKGRAAWELCPVTWAWGWISVTHSLCFAVSGKVVHLSHVWCPPEQTPLLPLLCLLWLFYKETYSRAREDKATQFRWVLIPMLLIILCVTLCSRPVKWYFLVVTSLSRVIILFMVWVSLVVLF